MSAAEPSTQKLNHGRWTLRDRLIKMLAGKRCVIANAYIVGTVVPKHPDHGILGFENTTYPLGREWAIFFAESDAEAKAYAVERLNSLNGRLHNERGIHRLTLTLAELIADHPQADSPKGTTS